MSQITKKEIEYLADISKLILTDEEKEIMIKDLNKMKNFFQVLQKLDTENVEPLHQIHFTSQDLRQDSQKIYDNPEQLLKQNSKNKNSYFTVPNIMNKSHE